MFLQRLRAPLLALLISACASDPLVEIRTVEVPVNPEYSHPSIPGLIDLKDPEWYIIPLEDGTYAAVKVEDYQQIVENYTTLGTHIKELRAVIKYYRTITGATDAQ